MFEAAYQKQMNALGNEIEEGYGEETE